MSSADKLEHNSVEEYLQREANSLIKSEYIDGWIRAMTGASNRHNRIKIHCLIQLGNQLQGRKCQPFDSDTKVRITQDAGRRFYYPDVQVVCDSNDQLSVYQDHPVLIIEVLSPSTRAYDLHEKLDAYLSIPSLQCYIVLEQHQPISYVLRRRCSATSFWSNTNRSPMSCVGPIRSGSKKPFKGLMRRSDCHFLLAHCL